MCNDLCFAAQDSGSKAPTKAPQGGSLYKGERYDYLHKEHNNMIILRMRDTDSELYCSKLRAPAIVQLMIRTKP